MRKNVVPLQCQKEIIFQTTKTIGIVIKIEKI